MGKYIYSLGESGLWEASRPLAWPLILGFFWKIGLNPITYGKISAILFSLGNCILAYLIALKAFDRKTAFYTLLFFAFSPTFFVFNNILFSEMPSTFFLLLGIYFFISDRKSLSGAFIGVALMTRLFHIFFLLPILAAHLYRHYKEGRKSRHAGIISFKNMANFYLMFLLPVIPYLILGFYLYSNPFYPFALQAYMTKYTGWIYHQPIYFYFANLLKENPLVIFSIIGFAITIRGKSSARKLLFMIFLLPFLLYNFAAHKEMRLMIPLLPFIYMSASDGLIHFATLFKRYSKFILIFFLVAWMFWTIPQLRFDRYDDNLDAFYNYVNSVKTDEIIWISNPSFIAYTDKKADELIYYPLYNSQRSRELQSKAGKAKAVLLNTCDILPCPPNDKDCGQETEKLLNAFNKKLKLEYYKRMGSCEHMIFRRYSI